MLIIRIILAAAFVIAIVVLAVNMHKVKQAYRKCGAPEVKTTTAIGVSIAVMIMAFIIFCSTFMED